MKNSIVLRIFSGLHLGAEIELAPGTYVIGTDDSCDIILSDASLASRHAALRIVEEGGEVSVHAQSLDGTVTLGDKPAGEDLPLPTASPFRLGMVTAAWSRPSETAENWIAVENSLRAIVSPAKGTPSPAAQPSTAADAPASVDMPFPAERPQPSGAGKEDRTADVPATRRCGAGRVLAAAAAIALVGALCVTYLPAEEVKSPLDTMRSLLDEAGYQKLALSGSGNSVTVSGRLASDEERGRLFRLAQMLDFPVYFDVVVRSDAADALRASFNTMGLFPEVYELPLSSRPALMVKGYIRNGVLEEQALRNAYRMLPMLQAKGADGKPAMEIFREIRHEEDVNVKLAPALVSAGLDHVRVEYLPGRVVLHGAFTPESRSRLEELMPSLLADLGVPVPVDIVNESELNAMKKQENVYRTEAKEAPAPSPERHAVAASPSGSASTFKVTSVSMGAMRFITLESGERIFEGGELPGGFILHAIDVDKLTLVKNDQTTIYPLRGAHD